MKSNDIILRKTFLATAVCMILESLAQSVGEMIDGIVIGRGLGHEAMAAFGICTPVITVCSVFGMVLAIGARTIFSEHLGAGKVEAAQKTFSLPFYLTMLFSFLFAAVSIVFATPITRLMGARDNAAHLTEQASTYFLGLCFGFPAKNGIKYLSSFMSIDNDKKLPVVATTVMTVADIIMDILVLKVFNGSMLGFGLATSISYWIAFLILCTHFFKKNILLKLSVRNLPWKETGRIIWRGMPVSMGRVGCTFRCILINGMLATMSTSAAISAYSVFRNIDGLFNPFTIGMADAAAIIAGVLHSEQNKPAMRRLFGVVMKWTLIIQTTVAVLGYIAAPWLASLFMKGGTEALPLSVDAVHAYMFAIPFLGAVFLYRSYLMGIGKSMMANVAASLAEFAFPVAASYALSGVIGAPAAWYSFLATQVAMLFFFAVMITVANRRESAQQTQPAEQAVRRIDQILLLPASFDVAEEDRLDMSASSLDEVMAFRNEVIDFCERHGCDRKKQFALALCTEELGVNTVEHGFREGKENCIDMRLIKQNDEYLLRMRDNCARFDPSKQYELLSDDDRTSHIGIRLVYGMARKIEYVSHLDLNNLTIRV